jgi:glycosyltransferase involved in cell wall biosynthesis
LPKSIDPTVVFLGFVGPSKGFHVLMQAFEGLSVPAKLVVVGPVFESLPIYEQRFCSAQEWQRVLSVMRGDERVESVGPIYGDERFSYLRRAWVCAVPSFTEGGCLVLQEALAVGTQVVATRVGPLPEMLDESPGHRLVEANDPIGLRAAIEQCLEAGATEPLGVSETYLAGGTTAFELLAKESRRTPAQTLAGRRGKRVLSRTGSR